MSEPVPPFAPERAVFPFPALVALAARAGLGGARETLTGALMAARLAAAMRGPRPLSVAARASRAAGARAWLGALSVPAKVRSALQRAFAASAGSDRLVMSDALSGVTDVTAIHLDRGARLELVRLVEGLRAAGPLLAGAPDEPVE